MSSPKPTMNNKSLPLFGLLRNKENMPNHNYEGTKTNKILSKLDSNLRSKKNIFKFINKNS